MSAYGKYFAPTSTMGYAIWDEWERYCEDNDLDAYDNHKAYSEWYDEQMKF